jgi:hypothetical protein
MSRPQTKYEVKPADFARAAGVAVLVLVIDVLIAVGVVFAWSIFVAPGHPKAYYQTAGFRSRSGQHGSLAQHSSLVQLGYLPNAGRSAMHTCLP